MTQPLAGIRVLEMGQLIAGPFCGQILADFGAEVVKIEPPGQGDAMRQWGRTDEQGHPVWWSVIGRNKKSLALDLRREAGQALARELAGQADILIENFRVGTLERWGLGWEALSALNPGLIMVRVTGYGQDGPYADRAGFASVCEAIGGLRYVSGYPDRPPVRTGISLGDSLAGMHGALGAMMALQHRHLSGQGQLVDASIYESVLGMMESLVAEYDRGGHVRERSGSALPGIAPSNAYPAADTREVIIGANQDSVFRRLCEVMEQPELADDPRFASHRARGDHQESLDALVARWTQQHPAQAIVDRLAAAGVPAGVAYRAPDMLQDPHFQARQSIIRMADPRLGSVAMQNVFPRLSATPGKVNHTGPALGEHTDEVLQAWLGMSGDEVAELEGLGR